MMNKSQKYLTYTQVSEYLNLPIGTVYYLVHKKSIPHVRLGKASSVRYFGNPILDRYIQTGLIMQWFKHPSDANFDPIIVENSSSVGTRWGSPIMGDHGNYMS
ncbi:MAG: excisionase family DNA-binding protein [Bdellovibrionota bacterium]